jgi:hypothetical protein
MLQTKRPQTKRAAPRKRRSKVVLALGAGLSLSLASSASASISGMNGASSAPVSKQLYEEEISDVSLATFHVFDRENAATHGRRARLAMGACAGGGCGCAGCGCACGIGLYYHYTPPVLGDPVDPPRRPIRPAHKHTHGATR